MEGKLQQLDDPYVGALSDSGKENLWQNQGQGGNHNQLGVKGGRQEYKNPPKKPNHCTNIWT